MGAMEGWWEIMPDILLSGGAFGGDCVFDDCAKKAGHQIRHFSFPNHKIDAKGNAVVLNEEQLKEADPFLKQANNTLKRKIPRANNSYVLNLLRRNYWQIKDTERVYAAAPIDMTDGLLRGGTAWAVEMAIDRRVPEIYVFDLISNTWYRRNIHAKFPPQPIWETELFGWQPPKPHGYYTGIGSRELTERGEMAIRQLYDGHNS